MLRVAMLDPGAGKTHRAYLWSYCTGQFGDSRIVVYDFAESRAGKHAMEFMGDWRGALVCDDYSGQAAPIETSTTNLKEDPRADVQRYDRLRETRP